MRRAPVFVLSSALLLLAACGTEGRTDVGTDVASLHAIPWNTAGSRPGFHRAPSGPGCLSCPLMPRVVFDYEFVEPQIVEASSGQSLPQPGVVNGVDAKQPHEPGCLSCPLTPESIGEAVISQYR